MMMTGNRLMRSNILPAVVIFVIVVISALLSTDILTDHKTLFRISKLILLAVFIPFSILRIISAGKLYGTEIAFFVILIISCVTAVLTGSNFSHYVMTIDGPFMFTVCLSGMISLSVTGARPRELDRMLFAGILSFSAFMMLSGFSGFVSIAAKSGFGGVFAIATAPDNWNGILSNPNAMATHMLAGVISGAFCLESFRGEHCSKLIKSVIVGLIFLFVVDTLFLQCRGAFVSSLFFLAGWGIIRVREVRGFSRTGLIRGAVVAAALIIILAYLEYRFEVLGRVIEKTKQQKSTYRVGFWLTFLQNQISSFPLKKVLFGFGIQDPTQHWYNTAATWYGMHNFIFELWGRYGVFAALIACVAIARSGVKYIRRFSVDLFVLGFAAILMDNMLEDYLFIHVQLTTSMLGVFLFAKIITRQSREAEENAA